MSQTTGKTSTYIKNANVKESTQIQTGFKKVRFLHQADAGDTLIQLGSLTTPTGAVNYSAPSPSDLAQTNLMQWPGNFELVSSVAGRLIQNISYVITGAASIKLLYDAQDGEIFEGIIDYGARTGLTLVDAAPIVATGTLEAEDTDFNVGTPFQVGLYSSSQVGAVMVFVDGVLFKRNTGNNPPGLGVEGDYYEVHAGGGLGTLIRFNTPDMINDRQVMVISVNGLVERPDGSFMAVAESLQGQIDAIVPTVAALADIPETDLQATPNNVDLKAFGDRVLALEGIESRVDELEVPTQHEIWLQDLAAGADFGSTGTKIRRFDTTMRNVGTAITYLDSATDGASFTVNESGLYWIQYTSQWNAANDFGISLNASSLTTDITLLADSEIIGITENAGADFPMQCQAMVWLSPGDVVRCHNDLATTLSYTKNGVHQFRMTKVR